MSDATPTVLSSSVQDFSDNDVMDGFEEGPPQDDTPMGLGGEKGKQVEPASTTLEADVANQDTPGDDSPPDDAASGSEPAGEGGDEPQVPEDIPEEIPAEPETPEFPPALLQMAGYATVEQAQQAGFSDPGALFAAVQWKGKSLSPAAAPLPQAGSLYRPQAPPQKEAPSQGEASGFKPFQPDNADALDEEILAALQQQNKHFDEQFQQQQERFASELKERDDKARSQQDYDYERRFDQSIQELGKDWQDVFGVGEGHTLSQAGQRDPAAMTAVNHRLILFDTVEAVREVNEKQGFPPMDLKQEVQWALMQRYPDKFNQQLLRKSNSQDRRGTQTSRPTARKTPLGNKTERLLSAVDATLKAKGRGGLDMGQDDEHDGDF